MSTKQFEYNGVVVDFEVNDNNVMVNATQMAKVFNKQVTKFMQLDSTAAFINEALKSENSHYLKVFSQSDLYYSSQKTGTWMHRILALKFAAWLNPSFELWVYSTIDEILFGSYREDEESLKKIAKLQLEIFKRESEVAKLPLLQEIETLKKAERREKKKVELRKIARTNSFRSLFSSEEMESMVQDSDE